jgi:translation initiation factor 1
MLTHVFRSLRGCARSRYRRDKSKTDSDQYPYPYSASVSSPEFTRRLTRSTERNGRKTLTTIEGIPSKFDLKKILKVIKKQFACNGTIVNDEKAGDVIQLQGDQRNAVKEFLVDKEKGLEIDPKTIKVSALSTHNTFLTLLGPWLLIDPKWPHPQTSHILFFGKREAFFGKPTKTIFGP